MGFQKLKNDKVRNYLLKEKKMYRRFPRVKLLRYRKLRTPNVLLRAWKKTNSSPCKQQEYIYSRLYKYKRSSGQVLGETLVLLPLVGLCFIFCLLFFHVHAQHLWMDHQLYQSLICLAKGQPKRHCENQMEKKIANFLWTGKLQNIQLYKKQNEWKGSFIWNTRFWKIQFRQRLHLKKGVLL